MAKLKLSDWVSNKSQRLSNSVAIGILVLSIIVWALDLVYKWDGYNYRIISGTLLQSAFKVFGIFVLPILLLNFFLKRDKSEITMWIYAYVLTAISIVSLADFRSVLHIILSLLILLIMISTVLL